MMQLYTAITLMDNFTAALNVLYDEILEIRKEAIDFPTESVSLCDKMNFKQVTNPTPYTLRPTPYRAYTLRHSVRIPITNNIYLHPKPLNPKPLTPNPKPLNSKLLYPEP